MSDPWHCRQIPNGDEPIVVCEKDGLLARIDELEQVMRDMAFMSANKAPKPGDTHVDSFLPIAQWEEFRP